MSNTCIHIEITWNYFDITRKLLETKLLGCKNNTKQLWGTYGRLVFELGEGQLYSRVDL
ncbi:hypothetical protein LX64_01523 [Chitinophaga skermanii]|uniref:Uncharacterized protein n=1 Tax=Chitinophaga skermanii TaxID=331697 RepID=A0A327QW86_9BACT|nr:hypothetical protein LX64_01523 [Chitinophaga skermanii]